MATESDARGRSPFRWRRLLFALITVILLVGAAVAVLVKSGGKPLIDGAVLADGRVITVVSHGFIAAYIVELGEGYALVDATMDPAAGDIRRALQELGLEISDVNAIFLTHGHGDHIAGAKAFPKATVFALEPDVDLIIGQRTADNLLGRFREATPTGITVSGVLEDGQIIEVHGTRVEVFAMPGHTRGSAAYLIHGVLFLGDAAAASSADSIVAAPPVFSADRELARRSLHDLAERLAPRRGEIDAIAFGHQGPLQSIEPLYEWHAVNQ